MPSTHLSLHCHIVFGTKDHAPLIAPEWRPRLHAYLGGVVKTLEGVPEAVGGVTDHVHLLVGLRATHCLADLMRELKSVSSRWVHEEIKIPKFAWQEGYGAFTRQRLPMRDRPKLYPRAGGPPSDALVSRGILDLVGTQRHRIRPALRLLIHRPGRGVAFRGVANPVARATG